MAQTFFSAIAAACLAGGAVICLAGGAVAQLPLDARRPALVAGPSAALELDAAAFGVSEVGQLSVIPVATGGFEGLASVSHSALDPDFDLLHFSWPGPGLPPVPTNLADGLNGPDDEFQGSLDQSGLAATFDTGPNHPIGQGRACVATRAAAGQPFGSPRVISGLPSGYVDPHLGRIRGQDVLFFVASPSLIQVADIELDPQAPGFAQVSNLRRAVDGNGIDGLIALHSPTPRQDSAGETVDLLFGTWIEFTGADIWYQSTPEIDLFPVTGPVHPLRMALDEHGADWVANPLLVQGTAICARGLGHRYVSPERYDFLALNSASVPVTGGTAHQVIQLPLGASSAGTQAIISVGPYLPYPIHISFFGLPGAGNLCLNPVNTSHALSFVGGEAVFDLVVPPFAAAVGTSLTAEALVAESRSGEVWISNVAVIELAP